MQNYYEKKCLNNHNISKLISFVVVVNLFSEKLVQSRAVLRSLTLDVHWGTMDLLTLIYWTFSHGGRSPLGTPLWGRGAKCENF